MVPAFPLSPGLDSGRSPLHEQPLQARHTPHVWLPRCTPCAPPPPPLPELPPCTRYMAWWLAVAGIRMTFLSRLALPCPPCPVLACLKGPLASQACFSHVRLTEQLMVTHVTAFSMPPPHPHLSSRRVPTLIPELLQWLPLLTPR